MYPISAATLLDVLQRMRAIETAGWEVRKDTSLRIVIVPSDRIRKRFKLDAGTSFSFSSLEEASGFTRGFASCEQFSDLRRKRK